MINYDHLITGLITGTLPIAIIGFFIRRWVDRVDKNFDELYSKHEKCNTRLSHLEGKISE